MKQKILLLFASLFCISCLLSPLSAAAEQPQLLIDSASAFTERDRTPDLRNMVAVRLLGTTAECSGKGVSVDGSTVIITQEGVYQLSGTLEGQIRIEAGKSDKIQLVLADAQIHSDAMAAIYVKKADKVFVTVLDQTSNQLTNSGHRDAAEADVDAVLFSESDLTLNGNGSLKIQAEAGHGIVSKDSLVICGGTYDISAAENGITSKQSLAIAQADITLQCGSDGIRAKNKNNSQLGSLCIVNGQFRIDSGEDAISATGDLQIEDGSFVITTGGGSGNGTMKPADSFGGWGGRMFDNQASGASGDEVKAKGIKSDGNLMILGGSFQMDCADDAIHTDGALCIVSGQWTIQTADDAIHAGKSVAIHGGSFEIPYCYEGIEGESVTIEGGIFRIVSTDDGINAAGGADGSGNWGRGFNANPNAFIMVNGGEITILSDGDSLDSNGTITLNGGTLNLTCSGNGNTAIDYETEYTNNGAAVTTNDGSENGVNQMHGMGGRDQFGNPGMNGWGPRPDGMGNPPQQGSNPGQFPDRRH